MKFSHKIAAIFIIFITFTGLSQEKLKGNGVVTVENRELSDFTKIEIIDDITVELVYNDSQSVKIETDSNLQSTIITKVKDGVLTIRFEEVIGRNKELKAHINVNKKITEISAYNGVNVTSNNVVVVDSLAINAYDASKFSLKLNSKSILLNGKSSSNLNLELLSNSITFKNEGSCATTAVVNTQNMTINALGKSTINLTGTSNNTNITAYSSSVFKGKNFTTKNAVVKANNSASIAINASEKLTISSNNTTEIMVYSNPQIIITEFLDKATIQKKELN
jgi:hypothetical protein